MNRSESKYLRTAELMNEALILLLEKKDFEYITIKEICAKAGVNRSTFYLHYETMGDLLEESMEYVNRQFLGHMKTANLEVVKDIPTLPLDELYLITPEYLTPYLSFIKEHKRLFETVTKNRRLFQLDRVYDMMFRHVFIPILERFGVPEEERGYTMAFYIHGLTAIIGEWLKNDCKEPVEDIVRIITKCVKKVK